MQGMPREGILTMKYDIELMKRCIRDGKRILEDEHMNPFQSDILGVALALFRKRYPGDINTALKEGVIKAKEYTKLKKKELEK